MTDKNELLVHLSECSICQTLTKVCPMGEKLMLDQAGLLLNKHKTDYKENRPIELVEADVIAAIQDLAECVRHQADILIRRAEGIERNGKAIAELSTDSVGAAADLKVAMELTEEAQIARMKELELIQRIHRLEAEHQILWRKGQR